MFVQRSAFTKAMYIYVAFGRVMTWVREASKKVGWKDWKGQGFPRASVASHGFLRNRAV